MKRCFNGKMRMLSLLLSLVLVVGLMPVICLPGYAAAVTFPTKTASIFQCYDSGYLKSIDKQDVSRAGAQVLEEAAHLRQGKYILAQHMAVENHRLVIGVGGCTVCSFL